MFDFDPDMLIELAEKLKEEPYFGICLDYAHATISKGPAKEWLQVLKPYLKHMHINDHDLIDDLHNALGTGKIDYKEFTSILKDSQIETSVLVEVGNLEEQVTSLAYMKEEGIYPLI